MNSQTRISRMERAGSSLGRVFRALARRENQLTGWIIARGYPTTVARGFIWIIRVVLIGILLYTSIAVAAALIMVLLIARSLAIANLSAPRNAAQWRSGPLGFGLYDQTGWRIDPHDPNDLFREP